MNIKLYSIKTQKLTEKGINNQENKQTKYLPNTEHATIESIHIKMIPTKTNRLPCIL